MTYQIDFNGVTIADGQSKSVVKIDLFDSPNIRSTDRARAIQDGHFPGQDFYSVKTIDVELEIWSETEAGFHAAYNEVRDACVLSRAERTLEITVPGWSDTLVSNARCRHAAGPQLNVEFDFYIGTMVLRFVSSDPRLYGGTLRTDMADLTGSLTGRTYNLTFNRNYGGVSVSNTIFATNLGNYEAPWKATISGPVTDPQIEHVDSGKIIQLVGEVSSGETLVVNSYPDSTVLLNGTASRYSWVQDASQFFMLNPGLNAIRFNGSTAGLPSMDFEWRDAWV